MAIQKRQLYYCHCMTAMLGLQCVDNKHKQQEIAHMAWLLHTTYFSSFSRNTEWALEVALTKPFLKKMSHITSNTYAYTQLQTLLNSSSSARWNRVVSSWQWLDNYHQINHVTCVNNAALHLLVPFPVVQMTAFSSSIHFFTTSSVTSTVTCIAKLKQRVVVWSNTLPWTNEMRWV